MVKNGKHTVDKNMLEMWFVCKPSREMTHQLVILINIIFGEGAKISGAR